MHSTSYTKQNQDDREYQFIAHVYCRFDPLRNRLLFFEIPFVLSGKKNKLNAVRTSFKIKVGR